MESGVMDKSLQKYLGFANYSVTSVLLFGKLAGWDERAEETKSLKVQTEKGNGEGEGQAEENSGDIEQQLSDDDKHTGHKSFHYFEE